MAKQLPRFEALLQKHEDERKLARILLEAGEAAPPPSSARATNGGDHERLRGIPAVGCGGGHIRGTDPLGEVLRREHRLRRRPR